MNARWTAREWHDPRVRAWWPTIGVAGAVGLGLAVARYDVWWTALSQLTALAVATTYAALAAAPRWAGHPVAAWLRGALATTSLLVAGAFWAAPQTDPWQPFSVAEHAVVPALVLLDVLVVRRPDVRAWWPVSWPAPLLAYLGWYVAGDLAVYPDLDPARPVDFALRVLLLAGLAGSAALVVGRLARSAS